VRLRLLGSTAAAVVYSPHCFAFERRDVSALHRHLYRLAEGILARWTAGYVCVSPHEAELASRLRPDANVKYVINYIEPSRRPGTESGTGTSGALRLASVGRIVPQKDPTMFAEIVAAVRRRGEPVEAVWIGDGDDEAARRALTEAGVHVTGWMPSSRVLGMLPEHQYYVHTASWEAALPIAVLDAMSAGLPVLVRHGRAYAGLLPQEWLFHDVSGAVRMLDLLRDPARCRDRVHQQFLVLEALRRRGPDVVLTDSYRDIYESSRSRRLGRSAGPSRRGGRSAAPP
jgi:glycosyltransferase involved in cell wall biosynthesis